MSVYKIIWRRWRMSEIRVRVRNISGTIMTREILSIRIKICLTATSFSTNPPRPSSWSKPDLRWAPWGRIIYSKMVNTDKRKIRSEFSSVISKKLNAIESWGLIRKMNTRRNSRNFFHSFQFSQLYRAFLILSSLFIYPTNAQLDWSKRMLKFTLKVLLHVSV